MGLSQDVRNVVFQSKLFYNILSCFLKRSYKKRRALTRSHTLTSIMVVEKRDEELEGALLKIKECCTAMMKECCTACCTAMNGIDQVLAYSSRIEDGEPNRFVELKILNVWALTRGEDDDYRIEYLTKMKDACKAAQEDVKKKRLNWAIAWIDDMINNIKTGEEFDDTLDAVRYPRRGY